MLFVGRSQFQQYCVYVYYTAFIILSTINKESNGEYVLLKYFYYSGKMLIL